MTSVVSREVVRAPLPELGTGPAETTHSALQKKWYIGRMVEWTNFQRDASQHFDNTNWNSHRQTLTYRAVGEPSSASLVREHYRCGDETGVRGRFIQNIGQVMSGVSVAMNVDLVFADYKASRGPAIDGQVPDIVVMTRDGWLRMLGEIKTPWVGDHNLNTAVHNGGPHFRNVLGQMASYMLNSQLKYAFISTYAQTIFLKQEFLLGEWTICYSSVVHYDAQRTTPALHADGNISLRQCMWYIMHLTRTTHTVANNTPANQWVRIGS